jgi:hypothetical protein
MAFIDSKMAEGRAQSPMMDNTAGTDAISAQTPQTPMGIGVRPNAPTPKVVQPQTTGDRTYQAAQARSTRVYERPSKRRKPPQRDEADVARDSMIDQIMHEAQVPIYEQPAVRAAVEEDDDVDNDAATAEAFKAQLLAEIEVNNRRRLAKAASKDTKQSSGPKLGGSRSQREKMKALEEAKSSSSKK